MTTAVRLRVTGVDLQSDPTSQLIGQHFPNFAWASVDGLVTVTVFVDAGDVAGHVVEAAHEIENRIPGTKVVSVHRDLVTMSDIAARVGFSRQAIRKWTLRDGDDRFPAPVDTVSGPPHGALKVWDWAEVVPWLERVYALDLDEDLPTPATIAHIDACLAQVDSYLDRDWQRVPAKTETNEQVTHRQVRVPISRVDFLFDVNQRLHAVCDYEVHWFTTTSPARKPSEHV